MTERTPDERALRRRIAELEAQLEAIRSGRIDTIWLEEREQPVPFVREGADVLYRVVLESQREGVTTLDREGRILYANRAFLELVGARSDEVLGTPLAAHIDPETREVFDRAISQASGGACACRLRRREAGSLAVQISITPLSTEGPPHAAAIIVDLTEIRRTQRLAALGRLTGAVAHDFNNLLTGINGFCDLLIERLPEDDPARRDVEEIRRAGERGASITQQLLAFSRRQVLEPRVIDLNDVLRGVEPMLRRLLREDIALEIDLDPALVNVRADPSQMEQVVLNLVLNARDAMPEGGTIEVATRSAPARDAAGPGAGVPWAVLSVSDTGVGMTDEIRSQIFEPFFTTKEVRGTGLGLATVHGIVRQHEGEIEVETERGRGSTFRVRLPGTEAEVDRPAPLPEEPSLRGEETILVVEDEDGVREVCRRMLEGLGYRVIEARDGDEAVAMTRGLLEAGERPDLILVDLVMPGGLQGPALAHRIRDLVPGIRTLFMSGYADEVLLRLDRQRRERHFLQKPFTMDELGRKVREVLAARP